MIIGRFLLWFRLRGAQRTFPKKPNREGRNWARFFWFFGKVRFAPRSLNHSRNRPIIKFLHFLENIDRALSNPCEITKKYLKQYFWGQAEVWAIFDFFAKNHFYDVVKNRPWCCKGPLRSKHPAGDSGRSFDFQTLSYILFGKKNKFFGNWVFPKK